jgi:hypothetical protein
MDSQIKKKSSISIKKLPERKTLVEFYARPWTGLVLDAPCG